MKTRGNIIAVGMALVLMLAGAARGGTFDFVIETTTAGQTFTFYVGGATNFSIDWGDGSSTNDLTGSANRSHAYATAGRYTNKVAGVATKISFGEAGNTPTLLRDIVSTLTNGVTGINNASSMFQGATNITQFTQADWFDAASSNVTSMTYMFMKASMYNQDISAWNVSKVTSMVGMFYQASSFNQPIGGWDVGKVTDMNAMFYQAVKFNQPIGAWAVSNVTSMASMLRGTPFNQPIGGWNVGKVKSMYAMFDGASAFNQPIGGWNVSNVTDMFYMFRNASAFNQPIGSWNVGKVTDMNSMFYGTPFNQDISNWTVTNVATFTSFLQGGSLSSANYNSLLIGWSKLPLKSNLSFHAGGSKYDLGLPADGRHYMTNYFKWTITDGGTTGNQYRPKSGTVIAII